MAKKEVFSIRLNKEVHKMIDALVKNVKESDSSYQYSCFNDDIQLRSEIMRIVIEEGIRTQTFRAFWQTQRLYDFQSSKHFEMIRVWTLLTEQFLKFQENKEEYPVEEYQKEQELFVEALEEAFEKADLAFYSSKFMQGAFFEKTLQLAFPELNEKTAPAHKKSWFSKFFK